MSRSATGPALLLAGGLAAPVVLAGGVAIAALVRSPMESDTASGPVITTVQRAERPESETTTVTWAPSEVYPVLSRSAGTITALGITSGEPLADGDVAMSVDGAPVLAFVAPAPLYRDIGQGMTGEDVDAVQRFLVDRGYLGGAEVPAARSTARAIAAFNADHGRGDTEVLRVGTLLWVPEGSGDPLDVSVRVGDVVEPGTELYRTADGPDRLAIDTTPLAEERVLSVAGVEVALAPDAVAVLDAHDVAAVRAVMGGEDSVGATLSRLAAGEVGTIPSAAVVVDADGRACYFTGLDGHAVQIEADSGSFGLVDVDPGLIGSPVLVGPRRAGVGDACGSAQSG